MPYVPPTEREITRRIAARIVSRTNMTDLAPGGELGQIVVAVSKELHALSQGILTLRNLRILARMQGDDLDAFAAEVLPDGLLRSVGGRASCYGTFVRSGTVGAVTHPKGSIVGRGDGVTYQTIAAVTTSDGQSVSATAQVICQVVGETGNAAVGSILRVVTTNPPGFTFTNTTAATDGTERETDDDFRRRIRAYVRGLARCNRSAIEARVREAALDDGSRVLFAKGFPGTRPAEKVLYVDDGSGLLDGQIAAAGAETLITSALGTERVVYTQHRPLVTSPAIYKDGVLLTEGTDYDIDLATGEVHFLVATIIGSVYAMLAGYNYWTGLVAEAHRLIYGDASDPLNYPPYVAFGTSTLVQGASSQPVTVEATLRVADGFAPETVRGNVITAIVAYINSLQIGSPLYDSQIVKVAMNVAGVLDFDLTTPTTDTYCAQNQVPRTTSAAITISMG